MTTQRFLPEGAKARLGKGYSLGVAYSPDGMQLTVASSIGIWRYDAQSGEALNLFIGYTNSGIGHVAAYSPDGNTLVGMSDGNTVCLWDAATGELKNTLTKHTRRIRRVAYSPDGSTLASGSWDGTVLLWDLS